MRASIEGVAQGRRRGGDGSGEYEGGDAGGSIFVQDALGPAGRLWLCRGIVELRSC